VCFNCRFFYRRSFFCGFSFISVAYMVLMFAVSCIVFILFACLLYCLRVPVSALFPHQGTMLQDREICCVFRGFFCAELPG
jgi:hypothetical protein